MHEALIGSKCTLARDTSAVRGGTVCGVECVEARAREHRERTGFVVEI